MKTIYLATVTDAADFGKVLHREAFETERAARDFADGQCAELTQACEDSVCDYRGEVEPLRLYQY